MVRRRMNRASRSAAFIAGEINITRTVITALNSLNCAHLVKHTTASGPRGAPGGAMAAPASRRYGRDDMTRV